MPKHVLQSLDLTTLLVALDHLEEHGPPAAAPDPAADPAGSAYLTYIGDEHLAAIAARVPHRDVMFKVPGPAGKSKVPRKVFRRAALVHLLTFCFPTGPNFTPFVRPLDTIDRKYWRVLPPKPSDPA